MLRSWMKSKPLNVVTPSPVHRLRLDARLGHWKPTVTETESHSFGWARSLALLSASIRSFCRARIDPMLRSSSIMAVRSSAVSCAWSDGAPAASMTIQSGSNIARWRAWSEGVKCPFGQWALQFFFKKRGWEQLSDWRWRLISFRSWRICRGGMKLRPKTPFLH